MALAVPEWLLDAILAVLFAVLLYLLWKRSSQPFQTNAYAVAKKKKGFRNFKEKAAFESEEMKARRKEVMGKVAEVRRKYMKGEVDYATYNGLSRDYERELVEIDAKLVALSEIMKGTLEPSGSLKDLLEQEEGD